jgi:hypothetical protein
MQALQMFNLLKYLKNLQLCRWFEMSNNNATIILQIQYLTSTEVHLWIKNLLTTYF